MTISSLLQATRRGRRHCNDVPQEVLFEKYGDGLAPQECDVRKESWTIRPTDSCVFSRLTAIFLAAKTSNHPISIEHYTSNIPKTSPGDVLDLEFLLAQSLSFHFAVWSASRAAHGIWLDLQVSIDPLFCIIFKPSLVPRRFLRLDPNQSRTSTMPLWTTFDTPALRT